MKNILIGILILILILIIVFVVYVSNLLWRYHQGEILIYFETANDPYVENDYLCELKNINVGQIGICLGE